MYDIIVIGGGASGLALANVAKKRGKRVIILEAAARAGKKILVAGNGKCNLSNENITAENYNDGEFVEKFLQKSYKVKEFFRSLGIIVKSSDGRIYPYTESGNTVLNLLRKDLENEIKTEEKVEKIDYSDGLFTVNGYVGKAVALCTGGITAGGIASHGLLEKFGHNCTRLFPVLVPLTSDTKYIKPLAGVRVKCKMTLFSGKNSVERRGELLFKENGLSGIVSMELSRFLVDGEKSYVSVDFAPEYDEKAIAAFNREGLLQKAVLAAVERQARDRNLPFERVVKDFIVEKVAAGDKKTAQVTRGGLAVDGFDENLQSKLIKGLYACGEVLDVDGDCGGYNLHWAFLSGIIAGESV